MITETLKPGDFVVARIERFRLDGYFMRWSGQSVILSDRPLSEQFDPCTVELSLPSMLCDIVSIQRH